MVTSESLVRGGGLEPPHHCWRQDLNLVRLPISPPAPVTGKGKRAATGRPLESGQPKILTDVQAVARAGCTTGGGFPSRFTRNQAAYIAGSASKVNTVATISPPMMAT